MAAELAWGWALGSLMCEQQGKTGRRISASLRCGSRASVCSFSHRPLASSPHIASLAHLDLVTSDYCSSTLHHPFFCFFFLSFLSVSVTSIDLRHHFAFFLCFFVIVYQAVLTGICSKTQLFSLMLCFIYYLLKSNKWAGQSQKKIKDYIPLQ